jgi:hypothetical protein
MFAAIPREHVRSTRDRCVLVRFRHRALIAGQVYASCLLCGSAQATHIPDIWLAGSVPRSPRSGVRRNRSRETKGYTSYG